MAQNRRIKSFFLVITILLTFVITSFSLNVLAQDEEIKIGLITKTETNPFFVKMREGAQAKADELGVTLLTASGQFDTDNASQVTAIENMVSAGVKGILLVPADSSAIVPTIEAARKQGVIVLALDTPTNPQDATDGLYATDNHKAGVLIGQYAHAALEKPDDAIIALLGLPPGITVNELRQGGFLDGFGIKLDSPQVVCVQDTEGDQTMGQTAMENCLVANPDINLVYTINEPAAFGAHTALENAGVADKVMIVSVDGGCAGVGGVIDGRIAATSQQYPLLMASLGVENIVKAVKGGPVPSGYTDTGVALITAHPVAGVDSIGVVEGYEKCWGESDPAVLQAAKDLEVSAMAAAIAALGEKVKVGLITKTETNPFFVKMREGAQAEADALGITLLTASGQFDTDNASQVTAIENMVSAGVKGILLVPADSGAIVPTIEEARKQGVVILALDTPTNPQDATDGLFATDNFKAGVLIGQYAHAALKDPDKAIIALLGLPPGITVNELRQGGFLEGYGIKLDSPQVVCVQDTEGDQTMGQTAMENCLVANPDINLVYTINEPAAFGAYTALENASVADKVMIVSVDGGCAGVAGVVDGRIAATSQQYPLRMASLGVEALANYALTGEKPSGYTDTGVTLITDKPVEGVDSQDTKFGTANCWG